MDPSSAEESSLSQTELETRSDLAFNGESAAEPRVKDSQSAETAQPRDEEDGNIQKKDEEKDEEKEVEVNKREDEDLGDDIPHFSDQARGPLKPPVSGNKGTKGVKNTR